MGSIHNGDIVLVPFPFTDLSSTKLRPALVISKNTIHTLHDDFTLMFISSVLPLTKDSCEYVLDSKHEDFNETGLKVPSVFKGNKIVTLHRALLKRRLGKLSPKLKEEIQTIINHSVGLM